MYREVFCMGILLLGSQLFPAEARETVLLRDNPVFSYDWGVLMKKRGHLTASITGVITSAPSVGKESRIVVTSGVVKDANYEQFQANMGLVNLVEPYFLEHVTYLLVPKGVAEIIEGHVECRQDGQWHLVDMKNVLDAYRNRDSKAAQIIQTIVKRLADYALGYSDFINTYRKPDILMPDDVSFLAVPFMEHRVGKLGSYTYLKPIELRTTYTVKWLRSGQTRLQFRIMSTHNVKHLTSSVSKWVPQLEKTYKVNVNVNSTQDQGNASGVTASCELINPNPCSMKENFIAEARLSEICKTEIKNPKVSLQFTTDNESLLNRGWNEITDPLRGRVIFRTKRMFDNGQRGDKFSGDGVYTSVSRKLSYEDFIPGIYKVWVIVWDPLDMLGPHGSELVEIGIFVVEE